ncbi:MAG: nitrophenyl compound nitroreductase subunit ArsF family protein [Acidobacteriota bacterium]
MNPRRLITAALLLFVAASLTWLGVKEAARWKALKAIETQPASPSRATPTEVPRPAAVSPEASKPAEGVAAKGPEPAMDAAPTPAPTKPVQGSTSQPTAPNPSAGPIRSKVIVYYLHTTARCPSCLKIEAYTEAAVNGPLAGPLSAGRLEWKVLNVEEPDNAHFVDDYGLFTKSVVVSEILDGKEVRWKRLDKVWDYLGDSQAFVKYVDDEVREYLKDVS